MRIPHNLEKYTYKQWATIAIQLSGIIPYAIFSFGIMLFQISPFEIYCCLGIHCIWRMTLLQSSMWRKVSSNRRKWSKMSLNWVRQYRHQLNILTVYVVGVLHIYCFPFMISFSFFSLSLFYIFPPLCSNNPPSPIIWSVPDPPRVFLIQLLKFGNLARKITSISYTIRLHIYIHIYTSLSRMVGVFF